MSTKTPKAKTCIIPGCKNSSNRTPDLLFFQVPKVPARRLEWYEKVNCRQSMKGTKYCCQNHFNLPEDVENWARYNFLKRTGQPNVFPRLKKTVSPCLFKVEMAGPSHEDSEMLGSVTTSHDNFGQSRLAASPDPLNLCAVEYTDSEHGLPTCKPVKSHTVEIGIPSIQVSTGTKSKEGASKRIERDEDLDIRSHKKKCNGLAREPPSSQDTGSSTTAPPASGSSFISVQAIKKEEEKSLGLDNIFTQLNVERMERNPLLYLGITEEKYICVMEHLIETTGCCKVDLLITLRKIRLNESIEILADIFCLVKSTISKVFLQTIPKVAASLQEFIFCPDLDEIQKTAPVTFQENYSEAQSILGCFEIKIKKLSKSSPKALAYSSHKGSNTRKYLMSSIPNGHITFVSKGFEGRTSNEALVSESGYLNKLKPKGLVLVDTEFYNIERLLQDKQCILARPQRTKKVKKLSNVEVQKGKSCPSLRVHNRRITQSLRQYSFLAPHTRFHHSNINLVNQVVLIACALSNLQGSIIKL